MRDRLPLLAGLTLLALALGLGSYAIADGIRHRGGGDTITVTGSAKRRIVSDYVVWTASVTAQRPTAAAAAAQLAAWAARVRAWMLANGARPGELAVQPVSTETVVDSDSGSGAVVGYRLTRTFEVRSARVSEVAGLAERSAALLAGGVPLAANPVQYVYTRLPDLRPQLLAEAIRDARNRARVLVDATGGTLGKVRGVNVGVFQVTSPNSTDVSDYGVYDTSTRRKDVTAVVNATFTLS